MLRIAPVLTLFLALALARVAFADTAPQPPPVPPAPEVAATPGPAPTPGAGPAPGPGPIPPPVGFPAPGPETRPHRRKEASIGERAARFARQLLGVRYSYGGTSPRTGFDCSGLVRYVWSHFGVRLPRVSYEQFDIGRRVARRALRPGDLVFFDGAGHVGLYIGGGRFIHAPHTGTVVSINLLSGPYGAGDDGARRVD